QPIVDAHVVDIGRRIAGERLPGRGVGELAGFVLDVDRLALGAELEPAVLQRTKDDLRARTTACRDVVDAGAGLAEVVGGEMRERLVEARGASGRRPEQQ